MHERSLVRSLLRQVQMLAAEHPTDRVVAINVRIGEFSGVETELLRSAFQTMAEHTSVHGAQLEIERVSLEADCDQCGKVFAIDDYHFQCPHCGSLHLTIRGGEEMILESISLEETQP